MRRIFFSNLIFVVLLNLLIKPLWVLGIDRSVQNVLGRESYGLYFALFNLSFMLNILIDMGVSYYNSRTVAGNQSLVKDMFAQAVALKLFLSIVYIVGSICVAIFWGITGNALVWLMILCFNQVLQSFTIYLRSNLSALQHYRMDSLVSVADKALMIVLFGVVLLTPSLKNSFTLEWFIYGQTLCFGITLLMAVWLNMKYAGHLNSSINWKAIKNVWLQSYPYALPILFMTLYARIDGVMLERIISSTEAGIYASGYRLFDAANQFGYLFAMLLLPMFSRMLSTNQKVQALANSGFATLFMFSVVVVAGSLIYRNEFMNLLYVEADDYSAKVFAVIMCSLPGSALVYIFGTLLAANANMKQLNIITAIGAVFNIALNSFLIPRYGAFGASATAALTNTLVGIIELIICIQVFKFESDFRLIIKLILFGLLSLMLFYLCHIVITPWWVGLITGSLLSFTGAWLLGLIQSQQWMQALRLREG